MKVPELATTTMLLQGDTINFRWTAWLLDC